MLARGLRSYHRPARLEEALELIQQGMTPLAGGTRVLSRAADVPHVVDLGCLGLHEIRQEDGDLVIGATVTLQEAIDSPLVHAPTTGLLAAAVRAQTPSWMIRNMATFGGEAVHGAHDSEVVAALLALNAVFVVSRRREKLEVPALRFLRNPAEDLGGDGLVTSMLLPRTMHGSALERVAVLPSAPAIVAVAAAVSFIGEVCGRARIAVTGLEGRPARIPEGESRMEGSPGDDKALQACAEQVMKRMPFRDDAHASAAYRRRMAGLLTMRALRRAMAAAKAGASPAPPERHRPALSVPPPVGAFTSGRMQVTINGLPGHPETTARMSLLDLLRREGYWGVKHGCETGECGACAVLLDGRPVNACLTLALQAHGRKVETVEGLGTPDALHPVQEAFVDTGAIQCGYCTPAMELCAKALLDAVPAPTEAEAREALAGCLCRCTGYVKPVEAVLRAAARRG